jgi:hypothetical protein
LPGMLRNPFISIGHIFLSLSHLRGPIRRSFTDQKHGYIKLQARRAGAILVSYSRHMRQVPPLPHSI